MRKLFSAILSIFFLLSACTKEQKCPGDMNAVNEAPVIKVISPSALPVLQPGDILNIKAMFTDRDLVAVASWEALRAAGVCGTNPFRGENRPNAYEYEMNVNFIVPSNFAGDQVIRLWGVDNTGKISSVDIPYKAIN